MRALLIVNPHATSTTRERRDVIVRALASAVDLEVVHTRYRGDATKLAATAAADKFGLVMTLGGDGTVNEAVNGLLHGDTDGTATSGAGQPGGAYGQTAADKEVPPQPAADLPALGALPGGNANVFTRSLQLPRDPVDAAGRLIDDLANGRERYIGLGRANGRYFTFNAGIGLDAEAVRAVEGRRAHGISLTPAMFARTALRQYYQVTDRRRPAITIAAPAGLSADALYLCIISNSAPWTYLGDRPVNTNPDASFDSGLDLFGMISLGTMSTARTLRQMLSQRNRPLHGRTVVTAHDLSSVRLTVSRPAAFQLDGEYMGEVEEVSFTAVPRALRVIGLSVG